MTRLSGIWVKAAVAVLVIDISIATAKTKTVEEIGRECNQYSNAKSCAALVEIARTTKKATDGITAVRLISDDASLSRIAGRAKLPDVRAAAGARLAALRAAAEAEARARAAAAKAYSDHVRANWSKLQTGMTYSQVRDLIGPFPQNIESSMGMAALFGASGVSNRNSVTTDLYSITFQEGKLVAFQLLTGPVPSPSAVARARSESPAGGQATGSSGNHFRISFRQASGAKQASAYLTLAVSWTFAGRESGFTEPDVTYSKLIGPSGLATTAVGGVALPFATLLKEADSPLRVYFRLGIGQLQLWWSGEIPDAPPPVAVIQLSPAWIAASKELAPNSEHPGGGISISSPGSDAQALVFFVDFTEVKTLFPGPTINRMGTK
jgi:hypothetical protein